MHNLHYGGMQLDVYKFPVIIKTVADALLRAEAKQIIECSLEREAIQPALLLFSYLAICSLSSWSKFRS
jgi:hypothetical protein